ncbi:olfactory receptor 1020-like [Rhinatrema bivittatum]|uniref:olfactory receptor 1020-like n=1 Tax=Rhinatrema bivittatum TaxID=194408 RepID=UPI00112DFDD1|nr:olfactory receptor 1020-like [Rhinatrema bivittatum]
MAERNDTSLRDFVLLGFTSAPHLQVVLFVGFLLIYLTTLLGNLGIILVIQTDSHLHTPMYFFLANLAFVDLWYSSVTAPKMLINFLSQDKSISYIGCATQIFLFVTLGCTESLLLAAMAYDRYVAICKPLYYAVIMTRTFCSQMVAGSYIGGVLYSALQTGFTFRLSFCASHEIDHFFCDIPTLLKLSCTNTYINDVVLPTLVVIVIFISVLVILFSYIYILATILRISSTEGRRKAFSTCASHFICVTLFYGTIIFKYVLPSSIYSLEQDRAVSVIYAQVIPMLNPLIYSLRNKEVKAAVSKIRGRTSSVRK